MKNIKGIRKLEEIDKELANVMASLEEKWKEIEVEVFNHIDICEQEMVKNDELLKADDLTILRTRELEERNKSAIKHRNGSLILEATVSNMRMRLKKVVEIERSYIQSALKEIEKQ